MKIKSKFIVFLCSFVGFLPFESFSCNEMPAPYYVANLSSLPGRRPPRQDGSAGYPFGSLKLAYQKAVDAKACTVRIRLLEGKHTIGNFVSFQSFEIAGVDRFKVVVEGGFIGHGGNLSVSNLTLTGKSARAIVSLYGTLNVQKVTIKDYSFEADGFYKAPSAVEIRNIPASVSGLEILSGHQPALKISGSKARVKVVGLFVKGTRLIPGFKYPETPKDPFIPNYAAAVEVSDSSLVNCLLCEIRDVRYMGLFVFDKASFYGAALAINLVSESLKRSNGAAFGADALFASGASALQLNGFKLLSASRAGLILGTTKASLQNGVLASNTFGIVNRLGNLNAPGYSFESCVLNPSVEYLNNQTPYLPDGDLPVPNKPLPVPCNDQSSDCSEAPPPPSPQPPPSQCPVVQRL